MARTFSNVSRFEVPARTLFELYCEEKFQTDKALLMGALSASTRRQDLDDGRVRMVIDMVRKGHGGSAEEHATMTMDLDPTTFGSTWRQTVRGYENRADVHGTSTVTAQGENRCELRVDGSISIKVPLLGRMIERKIVDAIEREASKEEGFILEALAARGHT